MFLRELGKRRAPGYSRGRLLQRTCAVGALGAWILNFERVSASPGGLVETDCWGHMLISASVGGWGQRRGVPRWCWCCGPATTLGEARLRERTALPKNGCAGVGTRNRNTLQLSSISALHTLILLKHDFVYTFNLLKKSSLPSLPITVTTLNRKLQTIRDAPTFPLCSWRAGPFPGPQKILSLRLLHICSSCLYSLECILTLLILFAFQSPACSWRLS